MATIYTSCPNTGREISTGIEADPQTFMSLPDVITRVRCPHCAEQHNWSKYNAVLRDQAAERTPQR
jgi:hypothetical protein